MNTKNVRGVKKRNKKAKVIEKVKGREKPKEE